MLGQLAQRGHIEDECDFAVAEDGRAGHAAQAAEHASERLDDGLMLAEQPVDHDAVTASARLDHDHTAALGFERFDAIQSAQAHHRQHLAAQFDDAAAMRVDCGGGRPVLDDLDHRIKREDELGRSDADQKAIDDRQGERQSHFDRGALALDAAEIDATAQAFDITPHDIHADTAARQIGDLFGGGKARLEDECKQVAVTGRDAR